MQRGLAGGRTSGPAQAWDRLEPNLGWEDVALPLPLAAALREIPARFSERYWTGSYAGLEPDAEAKRSLIIVFGGAGAAEKVDAARVLGAELQLPVWRADLDAIFGRGRVRAMVQVTRLFGAARRAGVVLLLDGVEPLLSGGRDEAPVTGPSPADVRDILRSCDAHPGLVILAARAGARVAPALRDRIDLMLEFPGAEPAVDPGVGLASRSTNGWAPVAAVAAPPAPEAPATPPPAVREAPEMPPAAVFEPRAVPPEPAPAPAQPEPAPAPIAATASPQARARSHRQRLLLMALLGLASAIALGVAAAAQRHTPSPAPARRAAPLTTTASSGPLTLAHPAAWQPQPPPSLVGLPLSQALAFTSTTPPRGELVIGTASPTVATPLPSTFIARTLTAGPTPELVSLGTHRFLRVLDPRLALGSPSASVYALTSGGRTVVAVCRTATRAFVAACERVLATLRIAPAPVHRAVPAAPSANLIYARGLDRALATLSRARTADARALATSVDALAQSKAAAALAGDHSRAAGAIAALRVTGPAAAANGALVSALHGLSSAYTALSQAALAVRPADYTKATHSVATASAAFTAALARLRGLGFSVR